MRRFSIKKAVCTAVVMTMLFPVSGFVLADETVPDEVVDELSGKVSETEVESEPSD